MVNLFVLVFSSSFFFLFPLVLNQRRHLQRCSPWRRKRRWKSPSSRSPPDDIPGWVRYFDWCSLWFFEGSHNRLYHGDYIEYLVTRSLLAVRKLSALKYSEPRREVPQDEPIVGGRHIR
jgi:hypothetical protein